MTPFTILRYPVSDRLEMRLLEPWQTDAFYAAVVAYSDDLSQWLPWVHSGYSYADAQRQVAMSLTQYSQNGGFMTSIWWQDQFVGELGYTFPIDWLNRSAQFTGWLVPSARGKGLMRSCLDALVSDAFNRLKLNRVEVRAAADNTSCHHVLTRCRFQREAVLSSAWMLRGQPRDVAVYGITAQDWQTAGEEA